MRGDRHPPGSAVAAVSLNGLSGYAEPQLGHAPDHLSLLERIDSTAEQTNEATHWFFRMRK
jgi:hypothetical protein